MKSLNQQQQIAVQHDQGPLLIVAGAGTGKTTVITERINYLVQEKKVRPDNILALTFTEKAAGEMEERVDQLLPYGYVDLWIYTFHAFAERILKDHALEIGLPNDFKVLNQTQQWLLVRQNLDKFNLDYYKPLGNPTKFIHALIRHFSSAKDENITPDDYLKYAEELKMNADSAEFISTVIDDKTREKLSKTELKEVLAYEIIKHEEVANAYHTYQQLLLDNNALDFGDLINYCLRLFQKRKNILAQYHQQFKYILVDEFQDTNYAQYELVKLLASSNNNIVVVADDDQAIYRWRGASLSNVLQFKKDYPDAKQIVLKNNYRSTQNILDLSHQFIQANNPNRLECQFEEESDIYKNAKKQGVDLSNFNAIDKKLIAQTKRQGIIKHLHGKTLAEEVELVVKKIIELKSVETRKAPSWSDFAILVRANASAESFIYGLEKAGLPYNFVANRGLYNKKVVLDILAYLKLLDNYHEASAMYRILSLPLWQFSAPDIIHLNYWSKRKGWSLYEVLKQIDVLKNISLKAKKETARLLGFIDQHSQLARAGRHTTEIIQAFLQDTGYLKGLTAEDSLNNREQLNYLNQFYKKVQEFERETVDKSIKNYLALVELELESGEQGSLSQNLEDEGPDTVKIMTIHSAKGLEFKYVFVVNMVDQRFPTVRRGEPIALPEKLVKEILPEGDVHLQEERRLFYVAMTRAKNGLYFASAEDYGGVRKKKLSRFLTELAEQGNFPLSEREESGAKRNERGFADDFDKFRQPHPTSPWKGEEDLPKKFSFTQLKAFETCPYQYFFAHILRIPCSGKPQFSFGKTMHSSLEKLFRLIKNKKENQQADLFDSDYDKNEPISVSLDELTDMYKQTFIDDWFPNQGIKNEYFKKGKEILRGFYAKHHKNWPEVIYLEFPFNLKVSGFTITGKIDRIDTVGDKMRLVDYKTGTPKLKLTLDEKEQLLIYQMAVSQVLGSEVEKLVFYYLDNNSEVEFFGQEKELAKVENKIINTIEEIKKGEFTPTPGMACQWCDFKNICEFRAK